MAAFEEPAQNEGSAGEAKISHAEGAGIGTRTKATWKKNTTVGIRQSRAGRSLGLAGNPNKRNIEEAKQWYWGSKDQIRRGHH